MGTQNGTNLTCEIDGTDQGMIELLVLQGAHAGLQRADAGSLLSLQGVGGSPDAKFAGESAGDDPAEGAHGAIGIQGRSGGVAQGVNPVRELFLVEIELKFLVPLASLVQERPAEVKVSGIEIKPDSDEDPCSIGLSGIRLQVVERAGGHLQP